jgi:pyruvate kinase
VILYTQQNAPLKTVYASQPDAATLQVAISKAVIKLADSIHADAIVAETKSGATAIQIAALRPVQPLIAVTSQVRTANQLALVYGIKSYVRPDDKFAATKLTNWLQSNKVLKKGDIIVSCSGKYPGVVGKTDTIKVRILE